MAESRPELAFSQLPAPPPEGWLQFFDGFFPALAAGDYTIGLTHTVSGPGTPSYSAAQPFTVQAPEFAIDTTIVQNAYPPLNGSDRYEQNLPFVVLSDPELPWERALAPGAAAATPGSALPWMALVAFAEGEIQLPAGGTNPAVTRTVAQLLASDPNVLKPQLPQGWVASDVLASQCQTITVSGAAFAATMPQTDELPLLAHVRSVNSAAEGQQLLSVLLANRFPQAQGSGASATALRWYAHLVSLEGFAAYLGPNPTPIPAKPGGGPQDVMLVSLFNWTFVAQPDAGFDFARLARGLVESEAAPGTPLLCLPVAPSDLPSLPPAVAARLQQGYAPLTFATSSGEQSFAWYRGPFSAVVSQPLPAVGEPAVAPGTATSADALMIYLAEQGLFDLSYAAAWNVGRNLALADASFAQAVHALRLGANGALATLAQRLALPHFAGRTDPRALLARDATRRSFSAAVGSGLGARWHGALDAARGGAAPRAASAAAAPSGFAGANGMTRGKPRLRLTASSVLAQPGVAEALGEHLAPQVAPVARWLERAMLLEDVPFSHLVPDPRMLPAESVRFFYLDQGWLDAFTAGALSLAVHSSADVALQGALLPRLKTANNVTAGRVSGMLIRSQLVANWPALRVGATSGGAPLTLLRDDRPAPGVRLTLFQGVPDTVTVAQPYRGLLFGSEDGVVVPRAVTGGATGAQLAGASTVAVPLRTPPAGAVGGTVNVAALASALASATGASPFGSGAVVRWNGQALQTSYVAPNQLSATVPAALLAVLGAAAITVLDGGVVSGPATFAVEPAFSLDALSPTTVLAGSAAFTLTVEGEGFAQGAAVQWNGTALATTTIGPAMLLAQVDAALVAAPATVSVSVLSGGKTTNALPLPVVSAEPAIDALSPSVATAGGAGFTLAVTGSGFASGAAVQWNGSALTTTFADAGHLSAAVPAALLQNAGSAAITVVSGGATSPGVTFTVAPSGGPPLIGALAPAVAIAGGSGFTLTVEGANFASGATVKWNGSALATTFDDPAQLTATVPASLLTAGTAAITVVAGGATSAAAAFPVVPAQGPAIGLLVPNAAPLGSGDLTLTVYGGFGAGDLALQLVQAPELQRFVPA